MGFDAGQAVESLDFDFTKYVPECKGTIPEPTDEALEAFFAAGRRVVVESGLGDIGADASEKDILAALAAMPESALEQQLEAILDAVDQLCQGTPSREDVKALPPRVRQAFYGWLTQELASPSLGKDMRPSPATANGAGPHI